jgi:hypothetical protein
MSSAVFGTLVASLYFQAFIPRAETHKRFFSHLARSDAALPFSISFTLDRTASAAVIVVALGALAAALFLSARWKRRFLAVSAGLTLGSTILGLVGLRAADTTCAFPPASGLRRCPCPDQLLQPLECHCTKEGAVRERFLEGSELEQSPIGDRLFASGRTLAGTTVRETSLLEDERAIGKVFAVPGATAVCRYQEPCDGGRCGPCRFDQAVAPIHRIRDALRCVDLRTGERMAREDELLHLRRTVWRAPDKDDLPAGLPAESAIHTEKTEVIGRLGSFRDDTLRDIVLGAGQAPRMRLGGIRECRAPAAGLLARELDDELSPSQAMVVRLEMVAD